MNKYEGNEVIELRSKIIKSFSKLKFEEVGHSYSLKNRVLESTTTFIKNYIIAFDSDVMSGHVANAMYRKYKWKIDPSFYKRRWDMIGDEAGYAGSRVHEYLQMCYPYFYEPPFCSQEQAGIDFFDDLDKERYVVILQEARMFLSEYNLAGTTDLLIYDLIDNKIIIADWKTNEKSLRRCYKGNVMVDPFSDMLVTDINMYTLQTSVYQLMLENIGLEVSERWIIQLSTPSDELTDKYVLQDNIEPFKRTSSYTWYKVPYEGDRLLEELKMRNTIK